MNFQKPSPELAALFDSILPDDPAVERRKMFGFPAAFVNGNLFASAHQTQLVVRLPEDAYQELLAIPEAAAFEPMPGRVMRGYAVLPAPMHKRQDELRAWMNRGFQYVAALPAKKSKATRSAKSRAKPE
jgi:TfoX/Sxy family transcriptional regulator of competence genes